VLINIIIQCDQSRHLAPTTPSPSASLVITNRHRSVDQPAPTNNIINPRPSSKRWPTSSSSAEQHRHGQHHPELATNTLTNTVILHLPTLIHRQTKPPSSTISRQSALYPAPTNMIIQRRPTPSSSADRFNHP
jgi:hypothetical protein